VILDEKPFHISVRGVDCQGYRVDVGNPHFVLIDVGDDWRSLAAEIVGHETFPRGTNVEFLQILSKNEIFLRIWERGVGEVLSCGSGAAASVAVGCGRYNLKSPVFVRMEGGTLVVTLDNDFACISGPIY
jgi:diaminopimelate epimerase